MTLTVTHTATKISIIISGLIFKEGSDVTYTRGKLKCFIVQTLSSKFVLDNFKCLNNANSFVSPFLRDLPWKSSFL